MDPWHYAVGLCENREERRDGGREEAEQRTCMCEAVTERYLMNFDCSRVRTDRDIKSNGKG